MRASRIDGAVNISNCAQTVRLLHFFHEGKLIVVTNMLVKKSQKTQPMDIALEKQRREDNLTCEEH